eukprot:m.180788 g.180788  ORF g.180788 m.180788 type:complete len:209 (+) comp18433_c0_seq1:188-814(+)
MEDDSDDWEALDDAGTFDEYAQAELERKEKEEEERKKRDEEERKRREQAEAIERERAASRQSNEDLTPMLHAQMEASLTLQAQPPQQQFKILKRREAKPQAPKSTAPSVKKKSLAEKEAEYAAARARIMGKNGDASGGNNGSGNAKVKGIAQRGGSDSGGSGASTPSQTSPKTQRRAGKNSDNDAIVREPLGPDGGKGFQARRSLSST